MLCYAGVCLFVFFSFLLFSICNTAIDVPRSASERVTFERMAGWRGLCCGCRSCTHHQLQTCTHRDGWHTDTVDDGELDGGNADDHRYVERTRDDTPCGAGAHVVHADVVRDGVCGQTDATTASSVIELQYEGTQTPRHDARGR